MKILTVENLVKQFGGLYANNKISFSVAKGEILGIIGPNGAGKTTLFNCIAGLHTISSGRIIFDNEDISKLTAYQVARKGLARTFQVYTASGDLNVEENIMVGSFMRTRSTTKARKQAQNILEMLRMQSYASALVSDLPVAAQKQVAMATALATMPKILLLDEVAAGLTPSEIEDMMTNINHIQQQLGITIILIEHVMELVMNICKRLIVLDYGQKIAEGDPEKITKDPQVIKAYLGERYVKEHAGEFSQ